jgi:mRNA export factor
VNDICFHKEYETFCTAGSDGAITFWDGMGRTKLKGEPLP